MPATKSATRFQASRWDIVAAFVFGVVFVTAILALAVAFPEPTAFQYTVFRIVLALACAGVAVVVPGFLNLKISLPLKSTLRAGGALAVFALVYFYNPAKLVVDTSSLEQTVKAEAKKTREQNAVQNAETQARLADIQARLDRLGIPQEQQSKVIEELKTKLAETEKALDDARYGDARQRARAREALNKGNSLLAIALLEKQREKDRQTQATQHAKTNYDLGNAYFVALKFDAALAAYEEAARLDPKSALYSSEAGRVLINIGRYQDAIKYYTRALAMYKQMYGDKPHPAVAADLSNLGVSWYSIGEYQKALNYYTRALAMLKQVYGDKPNPTMAKELNNLGMVWIIFGDYKKAIDFITQALAIEKQVHGDKLNPSVAVDMNNLGGAWDDIGDHKKAIDYYKQALAMDKQVYGEKPHPSMALYLNNLGGAWNNLGEYHKAIDYFSQALTMDKEVYGDKPHPAVASDLNNLGFAWNKLGEYHKAIDYSTQALAMNKQVYGDKPHPSVAADLSNLGGAWYNLGENQKAIDYYTQALAILEATLPAKHPYIQKVRMHLAEAQKQLAKSTH